MTVCCVPAKYTSIKAGSGVRNITLNSTAIYVYDDTRHRKLCSRRSNSTGVLEA